MINSASVLIVFQWERRFTSAGLPVHLPFTHLKNGEKKGIICSCNPLLNFRLGASSLAVPWARAREENNPASSESGSLTFAGDGTTR